MERSLKPEPLCIGCNRTASNLDEYIEQGRENEMTPEAFVRAEEETYNSANGHFLCTKCYIEAGSPSSRNGWVAP
jgi:hypothetical protein